MKKLSKAEDLYVVQIEDTHIDQIVDEYKIRIATRLNEGYRQTTTWADRLSDRIAHFGGSWRFIIFFSIFLSGWMVWNTASYFPHFDEPPFILLNLCLSFIAAFQAPIILMSQNRSAAHDKHESIIDFAVNYKAEQEIADMQNDLHQIKAELTEVKELLRSLKQENTGL
ncbi:DUF1003 domain-containing protein [Ferviditalea candida]|uniref:DUF1003 domain-containing protein n=1 Tax=Ferviditalea candida TaxID=3108399 RepID=A0ABU5ZH51_9BACL|nr:DUF1003 domain-containing protein [Paenibacillaceae bacterium T2]